MSLHHALIFMCLSAFELEDFVAAFNLQLEVGDQKFSAHPVLPDRWPVLLLRSQSGKIP